MGAGIGSQATFQVSDCEGLCLERGERFSCKYGLLEGAVRGGLEAPTRLPRSGPYGVRSWQGHSMTPSTLPQKPQL